MSLKTNRFGPGDLLKSLTPNSTGNKYLDSVIGTAMSFAPVGIVQDLYDSAKDVYSDYQKEDYKSLGKKAVTEAGLAVLPYGVGKVIKKAKPVIKTIKNNINTKATVSGYKPAILEGIGPKALKNDGTLKRGVNEAGFDDFKKTGIVREKQGGVTDKSGAFDLGYKFENQTFFSPNLNTVKRSYYEPGGVIYNLINPNIKFKQSRKFPGSKFTTDKISSQDVDAYINRGDILGFRKQ